MSNNSFIVYLEFRTRQMVLEPEQRRWFEEGHKVREVVNLHCLHIFDMYVFALLCVTALPIFVEHT